MKEETQRMSDIEHVLKVLDIDDDGKDIVTNKVGMKKMVATLLHTTQPEEISYGQGNGTWICDRHLCLSVMVQARVPTY